MACHPGSSARHNRGLPLSRVAAAQARVNTSPRRVHPGRRIVFWPAWSATAPSDAHARVVVGLGELVFPFSQRPSGNPP